jgi:peptidoglycan/xylan/chitin deacetylase (PgdA/CDA1 family)
MIRERTKAVLFRCLKVFGMIWREAPHYRQKRLFLSFDDGPNPQFTPQILKILKAHDAKATFFLVGEMCERHSDLVSKISSDGHAIGNHSYDHADLKQASWKEIRRQIEMTDRILCQTTGNKKPYIRPPKGDWGMKYLFYVVGRLRRTVFWSADPKDYACSSGNEILEKIDYDLLRDGEIVLLHDKSAATVDAVRSMVPELQSRGFVLHGLGRNS